jgi:hypothetical protein
MTTLAALRAKVEALGGRLEDDSSGDSRVYQCVAPEGHVWSAAGDLSTLIVCWTRGAKGDERQALVDALDRVGYGVERGEPTP